MLHPFQLREIVRQLRIGAVIAYPTEAVFGLGCDPYNEAAVRHLLQIKQRPLQKGLILIAADFVQLEPFIQPLDTTVRERIDATWPGPVSWLLPARKWVPIWLRGAHTTLAVRITAHPQAAQLCCAFGAPLVSTSANISGRPPARTALAVRYQLNGLVDCIVPGTIGGASRPSEIRHGLNGYVVRAG